MNREEVAWLVAKSSKSNLNTHSLALSRLGSVGDSFANVCSPFLTCVKIRAPEKQNASNKYCPDLPTVSQMSPWPWSATEAVAVRALGITARHQFLVPMQLKAPHQWIFLPLSAALAPGTTNLVQTKPANTALRQRKGTETSAHDSTRKKIFVWCLFDQLSKIHRPWWGSSLGQNCRTIPGANIQEKKAFKEYGNTYMQPGRWTRKRAQGPLSCHMHDLQGFISAPFMQSQTSGLLKVIIKACRYPACRSCKCWAEGQFPFFAMSFWSSSWKHGPATKFLSQGLGPECYSLYMVSNQPHCP